MDFSKKGTIKKQQQMKSKTKKVSSKLKISIYRLLLIGALAFAVIGGTAGIGLLKGILDSAPGIEQISVVPTGYKTSIYDKDGNLIETLIGAGANREYVTIDGIPDILEESFIAIEDERFYEHNGLDVRGIFRAFFTGLKQGEFDQGASTITQQLIKNQVFEGGAEENFVDRFVRKIQEQQLSIQLEQNLDKETILEYYLNNINLGAGTYGVQTASNRYFNKDVSELNLSEATVIAAIAQSPTNMNPIRYPDNNRERRTHILSNMLRLGYCSEAEYEEALKDDVYSRILSVNEEFSDDTYNSYFIDEIIEQVQNDLVNMGYTKTQASNAIYSGGLQIYTTMDPNIQGIIDDVYSNEDNFPPLYNGYSWNLKSFPNHLGKYSYWELQDYRLSIQKKNGDTVHLQPADFENFFTENSIKELYESSEELSEKFDEEDLNSFLKSRPRFTTYFAQQEHADFFIEAFKYAMVENGDAILGESYDLVIQPQSSFVVMDQHNGHVSGISGGRGAKTGNRTLNRATSAKRLPGSTFKPLSTYLPALDSADMTLASIIDDVPYKYPNGTPLRNWHSSYEGLTTLRRGLYRSMNIVTVKLLELVTPEVAMNYLKNLGITTLVDDTSKPSNDLNLSLALGGITDGVYNDELTAAYASIANNGVYTEPIYYTQIIDHDGKVLIDNEPETKQVMKESTAFLLTSAMQDVLTASGGTGSAYRFRNSKMDIAGKTGTTTDDIDLWFSGFTPYYTATIWSGFDNNLRQDEKDYQKKIWRTIMERIHEHYNLEEKSFVKPDSVVTAKICTKSGKLAVDGLCDHYIGGSTVKTEYFAKGTVPKDVCDVHTKITVCKESGKIANEYCPEDHLEERVYLVKEEGANVTTKDSEFILPKETAVCDIHDALTGFLDDLFPDSDEEDIPDVTDPSDPEQPTQPTQPQPTTPPTKPTQPQPTPTPPTQPTQPTTPPSENNGNGNGNNGNGNENGDDD